MHNAHMIAHGFIGFGAHKGLIGIAPSTLPHISIDTLLGLSIKAKYSKTELGVGGWQLVARGNDSGYVVPHFSIPMANALLPLTIALGSSKVMFGASKVKISVEKRILVDIPGARPQIPGVLHLDIGVTDINGCRADLDPRTRGSGVSPYDAVDHE